MCELTSDFALASAHTIYVEKKKISPVLCEQEDACMRDSASWTNAGTKALLRVSAYPLTQTVAYLERVA